MSKRRFLYSLLIILLLIVAVAGWFATDYLGNKARQEIIGESQASALTLSVYVSSTLNKFEEAVNSLAGSPWIAPALLSKEERDIEQANSALDRYNSALNASVSYLMDADGTTVASSNRNDPDSFVGKSYRFRPYFQEAFRGNPDRYFALGITSGKRGFYASYPVQDRLGKVVGVVTMKKDIDELKTLFSKYPFCFLISRDGIIFLSSTPAMVLKSLWPLDKAARETLIASQQFGNKLFEAVIEKEIADGAEVTLEGNDYFVSRKVIDSDGWSIVLLTPTDRIRIYKLIGILATISVCFLIVVFSCIIYAIDRSKEAFRRSEELYKTLAEKSMAGVYVVQDGNFRFINSNAASYAGYTREELLDQEAGLLVIPEDREKVRQNAKAMLRGEKSSPYEFRIITKQGETRWIMETVTSILHEGRPAILGNSMDITEQKRAEEALRERELFFSGTLNDMLTFVAVLEPGGDIIFVNNTPLKIAGMNLEDIIGEKFYDTYWWEYSDEAKQTIREDIELAASGKIISHPIQVKTTEGLVWIEFSIHPIYDDKRKVKYIVPEGRDITDRKQVEDALRESEELYKTLAEKSMAGVYVVQDGKFRFINSNAASYAGYTREELLDQEADLIVDPEDREKVRQNAKAMLRGEMSSPYEYRIITKQGETRWIMETITSVLHEGRRAILGNSMDITERKKMEEEILTLSLTDPLTGLYNRRGFLALAEQQLKIATRTKIGLLLLFADLDGMKWINDNLGHKKGDEALMEAANVLKKVFRDADIVARVGGDEFSVLAVGVKIEDLRIIEDRLQYQIGINNGRENRDYSFSMSVGMAYNDPENPSTIDELMSHADALMYEQKKGKLS